MKIEMHTRVTAHHVLMLLLTIVPTCSAVVSPCDNYSCLHGGSCVINIKKEAHCQCVENYFGQHCEYNSDTKLCQRDPCQNGAQCGQLTDAATVTCFCVPGYHGSYCELEYNECQSSPCMHGTCQDELNKYSCKCVEPWYGTHCNQRPSTPSPGAGREKKKRLIAGVTTPLVLIACSILGCILIHYLRRTAWWRRRMARVSDSSIELTNESETVMKGYSLPLAHIRSRIVR